jgi:hypothetical protein
VKRFEAAQSSWVADLDWTPTQDGYHKQVMLKQWPADIVEATYLGGKLKEGQVMLRAVLLAGKTPVAALTARLFPMEACFDLVSASPTDNGHGTVLVTQLLRWLVNNRVPKVYLFADNAALPCPVRGVPRRPSIFFGRLSFRIVYDREIGGPTRDVQRRWERMWLPEHDSGHNFDVIPMLYNAPAEARLLMCQMAAPVRQLYLRLKDLTARLWRATSWPESFSGQHPPSLKHMDNRPDDCNLTYKILGALDNHLLANEYGGLIPWLHRNPMTNHTAVFTEGWGEPVFVEKMKDFPGCENGTLFIIIEMAMILRVLPDLPRSEHDLAWDTQQQETPDAPYSVSGLGGWFGNTTLKEALAVLLHYPLLLEEGAARVLTLHGVQKVFETALLASRMQYTMDMLPPKKSRAGMSTAQVDAVCYSQINGRFLSVF